MAEIPVAAKKSSQASHVAIKFSLSAWERGNSVRTEAKANITTDQARALAASLIALADVADVADAAAAKIKAASERRAKWFDREVAAGRAIRFNASEFFRK